VPSRYQKDVNVIGKQVTPEYHIFERIFSELPKDCRVLDVACAEGFIAHLAVRAGLRATGIEIGGEKVALGKKQFPGVDLCCGNIFENLSMIQRHDVYVVSRFFHNVGEAWSNVLVSHMLANSAGFLLLVRHKPGLLKETGEKRQPLATAKGVNSFLKKHGLNKKTFRGEVIVAAHGEKYEKLLSKLAHKHGSG